MVGEIFQIEGEVNSTRLQQYLRTQPSSTKYYSVTVALINTLTHEQTSFTQHLKTNQRKFTEQCFFRQPGTYYIGIYIGGKGTTTPKIYRVLEQTDF